MIVQENVSLKHLNTFGIDFSVDHYVVVDSLSVLKTLSEEKKLLKNKIQVGGGSNILCIDTQLHATLIHNQLKGRKIVKENEEKNDVNKSFYIIYMNNKLNSVREFLNRIVMK